MAENTAIHKNPYSYHTFLFPFIWNCNKKTSFPFFRKCDRGLKKVSQFTALLDKRWERVNVTGNSRLEYTENADVRSRFEEYYSNVRYFKKDAAGVLLDECDGSVVERFVFTVNGKTNFSRVIKDDKIAEAAMGKYKIWKETKEWDDKEKVYKTVSNCRYDLEINQIRLAVFDTGVALLSLELEYWGDKTVISADGKKLTSSRCLDDVNCINEYGRRITLPYIAPNHGLVADKIEITIGDFETHCDFKETLDKYFSGTKKEKAFGGQHIMDPIKKLLSENKIFTTNPCNADKKGVYLIEPVIDDRMYVCCCVIDKKFNGLYEKDENGEYKVFSDEEIYKLAFIETSLSCQSDRMMSDILKRCVYDRWINYGTVDIVTHHSIVRATSASGHVANSFLSQYVRLAELAVIQRATLISLENDCYAGSAKKIAKLQEKYVKAQQKILIDEATVQEQGVEVFEMIRRELFIHERRDSLDKRINDLYELQNLNHDRKIACWGVWLAIFAVFPGVCELLGMDIFEILDKIIEGAKWLFEQLG